MTQLLQEQEIAKNKLIQIFRFLQSMDQLRNPVKKTIEEQPWKMWFHDLPNYYTIQRAKKDETDIILDHPYLLKVRRPEVTNCPEPPAELIEWLEPGWQRYNAPVVHIPERDVVTYDGNIETECFDQDPHRIRLYHQWLEERDQWAIAERPAREAMKVYEKLYELHSQLERDNEQLELLLGDGILSWTTDTETIHHPILLQRVQLHFNPAIPEFTLIDTDHTSELYTPLLRSLPTFNAAAITRAIMDLEEGGWHPLDGEGTNAFLQRLVTQLSAKGEFVGTSNSAQATEQPKICRAPVLFVRKRSFGFTQTIEAILEDLPHRDDYPEAVSRIAGIYKQNEDERVELDLENIDRNGEDERVLLSKEANAEQLRIALQLDRYGSVLVQGPPGTGKTHTIANLLGHLLAQGKRVLVTSHTAKALSVLRDQVSPQLQSLCVSLLDHEQSKEQLEASIDFINEQLSSLDPDLLKQEIAHYERERKKILDELKVLRNQLKQARIDEYRPIVLGDKQYEPSKAAKLISERKEEHGWIPSPVKLGESLPLTVDEIHELYSSTVHLTVQEEEELQYELPDMTVLPSDEEISKLVTAIQQLQSEDRTLSKRYWQHYDQTEQELERLLEEINESRSLLTKKEHWIDTILAAGKVGGGAKQVWEQLLEHIDMTYQLVSDAQVYLLNYGPELSPHIDLNTVKTALEDVLEHMYKHKRLNKLQRMFDKSWKYLQQVAKVNQEQPESIEHFEALLYLVKIRIERQKLIHRWGRQVSSIGGPEVYDLGNEPEKIARQYAAQIRSYIEWYSRKWTGIEQRLMRCGFRWQLLLEDNDDIIDPYEGIGQLRQTIEQLAAIIKQRLEKFDLERYTNELQHIRLQFEMFSGSKVVNEMLEAIDSLDIERYRNALETVKQLHEKRLIRNRRVALLERLRQVAPVWARAIQKRIPPHDNATPPGDIDKAWEHRQLEDELERRCEISLSAIQQDITQKRSDLRDITTTLIEKKAWYGQILRTTPEQRQVLSGWKMLMKKAGKRTGKRAPKLLAEARRLMPICQTAVPVWIMPISRVVESFDPKQNVFDVVIIDEASQSDVMALTALYFGRQVVVVGDDEQVSPDAVGQKVEDIQRIIDMMLQGIPNKQLYDGQTSIYDLAKTSFAGIVQLREHFRCVEPIIQFSNMLSYKGEIQPLRDASAVVRKPHTIAYKVEGFEHKRVNEVEALHTASLLIAAIEQEEYRDATFGVISLIGDDQANRIDALLRKYLSPVEYKKRMIRCGNSSQFQGDERDVIFLSMVSGPSGRGPLRVLADPGERMKKRWNVAVSRARDQIWLIHSLDPVLDLKGEDLRKRLIEHFQNPDSVVQAHKKQSKRFVSELEMLVLRRLQEEGYKVTSQWFVGASPIDIVVEGGGKRLAIECDGDRWFNEHDVEDDMTRQAILERLGWQFVRIRGSLYYRDPERALKPIWEKLEQLGIPREGDVSIIHAPEAFELKERIIRRAAEIRQSWYDEESVERNII